MQLYILSYEELEDTKTVIGIRKYNALFSLAIVCSQIHIGYVVAKDSSVNEPPYWILEIHWIWVHFKCFTNLVALY